jgi:hypothetical protein
LLRDDERSSISATRERRIELAHSARCDRSVEWVPAKYGGRTRDRATLGRKLCSGLLLRIANV